MNGFGKYGIKGEKKYIKPIPDSINSCSSDSILLHNCQLIHPLHVVLI